MKITSELELANMASKYEADGRKRKDAGTMRRAKGYYGDIRKDRKATECEAYALMFEKQWSSAGNLFMSIDVPIMADECYWKGQIWEKIIERYQNANKGILALYMKQNQTFDYANQILDRRNNRYS